MIIYFADRQMNILGQASTSLPKGFRIEEDLKTEETETGVATFSCRIAFDDDNRTSLERMTNAGNYLLRSNGSENEFYTIIDAEIDTKNRDIYIYAEDAGLDLINEVVGDFEADGSYNAEWYINKYITDSGFEIGLNEIPSTSKRKLKWSGEATVTSRLASIATEFGGYEISYSYAIKGLEITNKYVNIHKKRGNDIGMTLRLNMDIDKIVTTKSVANLATAFVCEGGVPENDDKPITFSSKSYKYDDGDFFVDGDKLKSRKANEKWSRYVWNKEPNKLAQGGGYIVRPYSYDTTDPATLCSHAITELKKCCDMEINYEVEVKRLPEGVKIGDRINIVDDAGALYVSTRILLLEVSICDQKRKLTLGENLIKTSGISQRVEEMAAQFASEAQSVKKALSVANNATAQANKATEDVANVEAKVEEIEATVENANTAANNAFDAAQTAAEKAEEAQTAANNATELANESKNASEAAEALAAEATSKAEASNIAATVAKTTAESASVTAQAAKIDAEKAKEDVAAFGEELKTLTYTMEGEYSRKTDLTETQTLLQNQISMNASELSLISSRVTTINETANDAKAQAEAAQGSANEATNTAAEAQRKAAEAISNADSAQSTANQAVSEAAAAKLAADEADAIAAQAQADLNAAKANLESVTSRVGATEEEVAAAQAAVATAQQAADKAAEDAEAAQATANTASANATAAQNRANEAKTAADTAKAAADEAKAAADKAQADVGTLAVRVTTAETNITKNSNQIALSAKKTEVAEMLNGYSTKEETEAAITLESDSIKSSVSETYATNERVTSAESLIQQLSNCIEMLVTDENGESLMTQTANGWTFSMAETADAISGLSSSLGDLQNASGSTQAVVETLQQAVIDHGATLEYVNVKIYEGEPCIELGESDSDFKLLITNTRIMFMNGANVPTYINTNGLVTQNIEVTGEIVQGGYVMLNTSDGGWGLLWKGVSD